MSYVSIDIETLGLDSSYCDVIEFGAVIDNLRDPIDLLPTFRCYVLPPRRYVSGADKYARYYQGEPAAFVMHAEKLARIADRVKGHSYEYPESVGPAFADWLVEQGHSGDGMKKRECCNLESIQPVKIVVAGKNFANFDAKFLAKIDNFNHCVTYHHRMVDPNTLYFDPNIDKEPPGLNKCLERAGLNKTVTHNALDDAFDVIRVLRHKWGM